MFIFGDGELKDDLNRLIYKYNLEQIIKISKPVRNIKELIFACDLFVFPSLFEGQLLVLLEAMALGKPVIATSIPGIIEILKDKETGILINNLNPHDLADAIVDFIYKRYDYQVLGRNARKLVIDNYNLLNTLSCYKELYNSL